MILRVELSAKPEDDGEAILKWLLEQNAGDAGIRWLVGMQKQIASLDSFPHRCSLAPESSRFPFEVRHLLYGRKPRVYRILFTVDGDAVRILHIRRPGQQPSNPKLPD